MASRIFRQVRSADQGVRLVHGTFTVTSSGADPSASTGQGVRSVVREGSVPGLYRISLGNSGSATSLPNDKYQSLIHFDYSVFISGTTSFPEYMVSEDEVNASGSFVIAQVNSGTAGPVAPNANHTVKFIAWLDNSSV